MTITHWAYLDLTNARSLLQCKPPFGPAVESRTLRSLEGGACYYNSGPGFHLPVRIGNATLFFSTSSISRAIRFTDPTCRPSATAISDTARPRANNASRFRSASVHSFGFNDFISTRSNKSDVTLGNLRVVDRAADLQNVSTDGRSRGLAAIQSTHSGAEI